LPQNTNIGKNTLAYGDKGVIYVMNKIVISLKGIVGSEGNPVKRQTHEK
jgi:hypothetical protein